MARSLKAWTVRVLGKRFGRLVRVERREIIEEKAVEGEGGKDERELSTRVGAASSPLRCARKEAW